MRSTSVPIAPVDRVLRDGSTVRIRPATPEDRVRVEAELAAHHDAPGGVVRS